MAADTEKQWTIREDGCFKLSTGVNIKDVTYNSSLNSIIISSRDNKLTVLDALSGAFLQKSDLSGQKSDVLECIYLAEKDKTVFCDGSGLGVRGDLQGILLLDTALQTPVKQTEDVVKIELPLVEANQLLKTLSAVDLAGKEYVDDFLRDLTLGIERAQEETRGNHKTAKWATVCLQMQHMVLKSVCSGLMDELTKTNQTGQGFPVASAVVDRLGFLLPSSRVMENMKEPVRSYMYSEAARRETFANWPHMNYKWALPEPMAQAGFFHHPNAHGVVDDRAMCFTCSVCLVCWEPTDEPWSEHERHSQFCPYIKGDYTQNVPLTVTYATQPAQLHGNSPQQKIACVSTTLNEDFIATSSSDGNIVVWDISHILKKHCQFDIDLNNAVVAMKTGLQIERTSSPGKKSSGRKYQSNANAEEGKVKEISLHEHSFEESMQVGGPYRPSDDLFVTALCVAEETRWREGTAAASPGKSLSASEAQLSIFCGVRLRQTKNSSHREEPNGTTGNMTVQLMNEVNEAVSSEAPHAELITDGEFPGTSSNFVMPHNCLVPYILVLALVDETPSPNQGSPEKKKCLSSVSSPSEVKSSLLKEEEGFSAPVMANNVEDWCPQPWEDQDCQIVGFTPPPIKPSEEFHGPLVGQSTDNSSSQEKDLSKGPLSLPNGPGGDDLCDTVDASVLHETATSQALKPYPSFSGGESSVKHFSFTSTSPTHQSNNANQGSSSSSSPKMPPSGTHIKGSVIQCLEFPRQFHQEHLEVHSITPSIDKQYVIVALTTKSGHYVDSASGAVRSGTTNLAASPSKQDTSLSGQGSCNGGGILVYRMRSENGNVILEDSPVISYAVTSPEDVITKVYLLPAEVDDQVEDSLPIVSGERLGQELSGYLIVTTAAGVVKMISLASLNIVGELYPPPSQKYLSVTYCSGIEMLCVCSDNGMLQFFDLKMVNNRRPSLGRLDQGELSQDSTGEGSACKRAKLEDDVVDHPGSDLLCSQILTSDILEQIHSLIQFENLMPRFTAVVPPCWTEIQQEQQQRRHPQHLQQQGEATQHTRTWKLTVDPGKTSGEHLMEILLPKPCSVGHVDIKFSLQPLCIVQPNIEVTLLKQNIGSQQHQGASSQTKQETTSGGSSKSSDMPWAQGATSAEPGSSGESSKASSPEEPQMINNVLDPAFLEAHNAEILCGPVKLANCLDLSGLSGLITLASPQLLSSKPRSLLLHIKGFDNSAPANPTAPSDIEAAKSKKKSKSDFPALDKMSVKSKKILLGSLYSAKQHKNIKGLFDSVVPLTQIAKAQPSLAEERQKLAGYKGCDWLQELSVTVRVYKKSSSSVRNEKLQRTAMIQDTGFHKRLLKVVTNPSNFTSSLERGVMGVSGEHMQNMALDVLIWALAVQLNDPEKQGGEKLVLESIREELKSLVTACYISGCRTTAHRFSRLLAICMECSKLSPDPDLAPAFSHSLLQALLDCCPLLPLCSSSGALRWFFTLLNRVKCMDVELVASKCSQFLLDTAQEYSTRTLPQQALLKTRYGLYGNPFEADLFDLELSGIMRQDSPSNVTPNSIFSTVLKPPGPPTNQQSAAPTGKEQTDLFEMLTTPLEKSSKNQPDCLRTDILGLLEVEPLHFRCHATSDGTRMERMDATAGASGTVGSAGVGTPLSTAAAINLSFLPQPSVVEEGTSQGLPPLPPMPTAMGKSGSSSKLGSVFMPFKEHVMKSVVACKMYGAKLNHPLQDQPVHLGETNEGKGEKPSPNQKPFSFPQIQGLLQAPPPQVLVIERMHSGARRFVTLDFGKPIVLTDVIIPSSIDLASLSIDVWVQGEELDGQRLVVSSDIGVRTLVLNNIMPPPVCRYLKITTVGRYSGATTRSRIPLGSFYGHTYILPWEWPQGLAGGESTSKSSSANAQPKEDLGSDSPADPAVSSSQASLLSQLALFLNLLEDLQCRFSLARSRLDSLLTTVGSSQFLASHVQYHLKRTNVAAAGNGPPKLADEDSQLIQAYHECLQLQLQLNLAQRAIHRLQTSLGLCFDEIDESVDPAALLSEASTDRLRVILESLLDTLLTSTVGSPAIPQPPVALYSTLTPDNAHRLFQNLCLHGTQRVQVSAGLLLVRVCGTQPWWGQFMGTMLCKFFHSQFSQVFPQDRVFLLLSALGQKSLSGPSAMPILDSLLAMLTSVLQPIMAGPSDATGNTSSIPAGARHARHLDLSLVSWILLFLCRNMDSPSAISGSSEETEKGAKKEREAVSFNNRWGFIESQWSSGSGSSSRGKGQRISKKYFHSKAQQRLHDIDWIKKSSSGSEKRMSVSKILQTYGKSSRKSGEEAEASKEEDMDTDQPLVLSRTRCLAVVQGLVSLLLSMDFTSHVDLFLIACKVLAKLCVACRPAICLSEAVSQEQLERLVLLVVDTEYNHDHMSWGGPWASHAITCLLQDILEGERVCPPLSPEDSETDIADIDNPAAYSQWLERKGAVLFLEEKKGDKTVRYVQTDQVKTILRNKPEFCEYVRADLMEGNLCLLANEDPAALVGLFVNKSNKQRWNVFMDLICKHQQKAESQEPVATIGELPHFIMEVTGDPDMGTFEKIEDNYEIIDPPVPSANPDMESIIKMADAKVMGLGMDNQSSNSLKMLYQLKSRLFEQLGAAGVSGLTHSLSIALDTRLEFGLETMLEHRLKVMQSMQMGSVQSAFSSALPSPRMAHSYTEEEGTLRSPEATAEATGIAGEEQVSPVSSLEMLSQCFERMFSQLGTGRVNLEAVLQLWLTVNDDTPPTDFVCQVVTVRTNPSHTFTNVFDATRQPLIPLSENAVNHLLEVGVLMPCLQVRTWVYLLQALCLLTNQRTTNSQGTEVSLAPTVLNSSNLAALISKFLSSHPPAASASTVMQTYQVGPAAVKIFGDLLYRLQCKSVEVSGQRFKEMLLKIVYNLTTERGAIFQCMGPLDAQVQFLEMLAESPVLAVDVSNALSVIQEASTLVYQHLAVQSQVTCRTSNESAIGGRSCFGGLSAPLLKSGDGKTGTSDCMRDQLMFHLLQLVNKLISSPISPLPMRGSSNSRVTSESTSSGPDLKNFLPKHKQAWADPAFLSTVRLSDDEKSRSQDSPTQAQAQQVGDRDEDDMVQSSEGAASSPSPNTIADIVVGNPVIMQNFLQALSHCSSSKLALMFAHSDYFSNLQKSVDLSEPSSVGDLVFGILTTLKWECSDLNLIVEYLFRFFAGHPPITNQSTLTKLSEPLLFFTLKILNSSDTIKKFIDLGGIYVVCGHLVRCSQQLVSCSPSIISTLMQNFSSANTELAEKNKGFNFDSTNGLQSFAQLGTITCSSPTASPADGLIHNVTNRRARSATWSYHFHPDELCVELTIHLPFAVLLKKIDIHPHGAAISTCPSNVSLQLSHDGNVVSMASPPLITSSLSVIRLVLQKPEVVTSVTLILQRPLDIMTVGLQKISLWGQTAFGENPDQMTSMLSEDCFSRSSLGWMQILHHCLMSSGEDVQSSIAHTVADVPGLLPTCTAMLVHPLIGVQAAKIESILVKLGLSHNTIGLALIQNILNQQTDPGMSHCYLGKVHGAASPYTVEILYRLGTMQDANTQSRMESLLRWLEDCAHASLAQSRRNTRPSSSSGFSLGSWNMGPQLNAALSSPSPEHVQCVAAILWHSVELPVTYPLHRLVSVELIRCLYDWACVLPDSNLRKAVYNVLCSACHVCPNGFMHIQEWMGIVRADGSHIVAPEEGEDEEAIAVMAREEIMSPGRMTDDSKAGSLHRAPQSTQEGMTDDSKEACRLHSLSSMNLDESKLLLLAAVCKSPVAIGQLMSCGLPAMLAQAVCEYCNQQMVLAMAPPVTEASVDNGPRRQDNPENEHVTCDLVCSILRFFTEISSELELKSWLGQVEGNAFWSQLLTLLCSSQYQTHDRAWLLSAEERAELETRTIQFFSAVIALHPENQLLFARVLCDVLKDQATSKTDLLSAMPLSGFMRRLLLQVLLEDEKIIVSIRNSSGSTALEEEDALTGETTRSFPLATCSGQIFHPRYGSGRNCQCIVSNLNAKCSDIILRVADTLPLSSICSEKKEDKKKRNDEGGKKKDVLGELDAKLVELITQSAGAAAKEKREKSPLTKTVLPPQRPARRGRSGNSAEALDPLGSLRPQAVLLRSSLRHMALPGKDLPHNMTLSQLLCVLSDYALLSPSNALQFGIRLKTASISSVKTDIMRELFMVNIKDSVASNETLLTSPPFPSALKVFASVGGLALLAEHLPLLFPEISQQSSSVELVSDNNNLAELGHDWVTGESSDELYDPYFEPITPPLNSKGSKHSGSRMVPSIPPHSLIAFGLFLRLPGYAEVLLKERKIAQCLLRLVLGVTDDGDGGQILTCSIASSLPTMPFNVLKTLLDTSPLTTDDGVLLRRMALDIGVVHLVLACLATLSHHKPRAPLTSFQHEVQLILSAMQSSSTMASLSQPEEKSQQHYWAKGTGFGTGSTTSSWDAEQAMLRQKGEEEHVACLLQVLASYMNPNGTQELKSSSGLASLDLESPSSPGSVSPTSTGASGSLPSEPSSYKSLIPPALTDLLSQSCLVAALSSYLRNDSVLDMARHVPLYRALLQLLRGIAVSPSLVPILLPLEGEVGSGESQASIQLLLEKMKSCVDTYASRLKSNKGKSGNKMEDEESEGLALLIPDIQETAQLVNQATLRLKEMASKNSPSGGDSEANEGASITKTLEERYITAMKELQFDTYEMVVEEGRNMRFTLSHHYESNVKASGNIANVARTRRLAQEAVTLSTSLPLAFSSSVFVRCDEERLDVMKVLITGPSETPYANGCFEFDVFFPQDYPNTPPFINMETTGNHTIRFNPNLYNDGKVCLSILNTWHGRPEEKWNAQTSSFLQVLVSIQSLILVSEPYFNEPGYERSRGTPGGEASSHDYDANIRQATVRWAMLEQLRNPSACFKEIIHTHFWLKRHEILGQCETWIGEMENYNSDKRTARSIAQSTLALKRHYNQLREELAKLKPPADLELDDQTDTTAIDPEGKHYSTPPPAGACGSSSTSAGNATKVTTKVSDSNLEEEDLSVQDLLAEDNLYLDGTSDDQMAAQNPPPPLPIEVVPTVQAMPLHTPQFLPPSLMANSTLGEDEILLTQPTAQDDEESFLGCVDSQQPWV